MRLDIKEELAYAAQTDTFDHVVVNRSVNTAYEELKDHVTKSLLTDKQMQKARGPLHVAKCIFRSFNNDIFDAELHCFLQNIEVDCITGQPEVNHYAKFCPMFQLILYSG